MFRYFLLALFTFLSITTARAEDSLSTAQQDEVKKLVRETLLANPEILMEAMSILQERQEQARLDSQKEALKTLGDHIEKGPLTPTAGNPKGDVTLIEFFDYQCGYCKRAFPGVMDVVNSDKNIHFVLKELAILGPESEFAARAALASQKQGKYVELHSALMQVRGRLSNDKILNVAEGVGLNIEQLKKDMGSDDVDAELSSTRAIAQTLGITGTPAFIIGNQIIPGAVPPEELKKAVEKARKK